jgi:hypothetical protein
MAVYQRKGRPASSESAVPAPRTRPFLPTPYSLLLPNLHQPPMPRHDRQPLAAQDLLRLPARVARPRPGRIEPRIACPVAQRLARLFQSFIRQRQVVVRIGILRNQRQRTLVGYDCLVQPLLLVQNIAQIEERQRIFRISLGRQPVQPLRAREILLVVVDRSACSSRIVS